MTHFRAMPTFDPRHKSRVITEGADKTANRSMLRAMGLGDQDMLQSWVGVATVWSEATPCNLNLDEQGLAVARAVTAAGCTSRRFNTISVSDGIGMGHEGMKASLVSREVIADSVELMMRAHGYDALVGIAGSFLGFHLGAISKLAGSGIGSLVAAAIGAVVVLWGWKALKL